MYLLSTAAIGLAKKDHFILSYKGGCVFPICVPYYKIACFLFLFLKKLDYSDVGGGILAVFGTFWHLAWFDSVLDFVVRFLHD